MKKIIFTFTLAFAFAFALLGTAGVTHAAVCGDPGVPCGNGPIVAQQPGGRFLKAGEEDCPAWFPMNFGRACYTFRAFGLPFVR
jgi:hypothetical protein